MSYTDSQMIIASELAYLDLKGGGKGYTVREALELMSHDGNEKEAEKARELLKKIDTYPGAQECGNWVIKDVCNDQRTTGMYGLMIETEEKEALIAFRGSEADSPGQVVRDWVLSDLGLLNNTLTPQQYSSQKYMEYIYKKYGSQYDSFGLTGHSLGGNLAEHAAIAAPDGMKEKISDCVNLDGPGFSKAYIQAHKDDIKEIQDRIKHYQWSLVGGLLTPISGTDYRTIEANTPEDGLVFRHDMKNVQYDDNGNVMPGEKDPLAVLLDSTTDSIDEEIYWHSPMPVILHFVDSFRDEIKAWTEDIREGTDAIKKKWEEWVREHFSGEPARFEVHMMEAAGSLEELSKEGDVLNRCADELERIRRDLGLGFMANTSLKFKIWDAINRVESHEKKLKKFCSTGIKCQQYFQKSEQKIAAYAAETGR